MPYQNGRAKRGSQANTPKDQELAGNAMILKRISQGNHDDGAELDGRLYYRVSTAFRLITVMFLDRTC